MGPNIDDSELDPLNVALIGIQRLKREPNIGKIVSTLLYPVFLLIGDN